MYPLRHLHVFRIYNYLFASQVFTSGCERMTAASSEVKGSMTLRGSKVVGREIKGTSMRNLERKRDSRSDGNDHCSENFRGLPHSLRLDTSLKRIFVTENWTETCILLRTLRAKRRIALRFESHHLRLLSESFQFLRNK